MASVIDDDPAVVAAAHPQVVAAAHPQVVAAAHPQLVSEPPRASEVTSRERLRRIVAEQLPTVWRFVRRLGLDPADADDAVQEVVLVVARRLGSIEPRGERKFLLRTAYRVGCRIRARRPQASAEELPDPTAHPDVLADQLRARELLDEILGCLNVDLRTVFVLHDIEGLTMAEIAEALEVNPGTVASRLRRAREQFEQRVARIEAKMNERRGER